MRKKKATQEDRISKLEKVVSQLYIRQVQLYQKIEANETNEVIDDLNKDTQQKSMGYG